MAGIGALQRSPEQLTSLRRQATLGVPVDVGTADLLRERLRPEVLPEAIGL